MTRHQVFVAVACLFLSACNRAAPVTADRSAGDNEARFAADMSNGAVALGDFVVAAPIQYQNLTIFPVVSKTPRLDDRFMTLEEGLIAGTVEILEMGANVQPARQGADALQTESRPQVASPPDDDDAIAENEAERSDEMPDWNDVNRLTVINRGDKPLYLMPGEIIVGGSQDRTIGEEMVIAATGKPVAIDVYCVEHGRWGMRDADTMASVLYPRAADSLSDDDLAAEANRGKFVAKAGNLSKMSRVAVQAAEGQGKVWDEVEKVNTASGATWASGAFTANYVDPDVVERLKPYVEALSHAVSDQEQVVGIVVAINGKIETVDVFESTPLFRKLWPQLLKSYALDADQKREDDDAKQLSTPAAAEAFLASVLQDQEGDDRKTEGGLVVSRHETKDAISFSAGAMGGGMGGGFFGGGPIHSSGFSK